MHWRIIIHVGANYPLEFRIFEIMCCISQNVYHVISMPSIRYHICFSRFLSTNHTSFRYTLIVSSWGLINVLRDTHSGDDVNDKHLVTLMLLCQQHNTAKRNEKYHLIMCILHTTYMTTHIYANSRLNMHERYIVWSLRLRMTRCCSLFSLLIE